MKSRFINSKVLVVTLFTVLVLVKLNYVFFQVFQLQYSFQNVFEPYTRIILTRTLPGLELKEDTRLILGGPGDIIDGLFFLVFQINSREPSSLFAVQFIPLQNNHARVMAKIEEGDVTSKDKREEDNGQGKEVEEDEAYSRYKEVVTDRIERAKEEDFEDIYEDITQIQAEAPKVLIYHSHTTESFIPTSGNAFSKNHRESIVEVGRKMKERLESAGLETIHTTKVHDLPTRHESYVRSLETIEAILKDNPQIEIVIDLHRDGIRREMTTASLDGEDYGKILFLVGSRDNHPDWKENYEFASMLNDNLKDLNPKLSRGIKTRRYSYNQEVHPRSVLIEIGGHENSLKEALSSVPYLTRAIKKTYMNLDELEE